MAVSLEQLTIALDPLEPTALRREVRKPTVRIVEHTRFPRVGPEATPRIGFTRDLSPKGMCIGAEPVDSLLRVTLRELDGWPRATAVDRVVWCSQARDGRWWLGLERLTQPHTR